MKPTSCQVQVYKVWLVPGSHTPSDKPGVHPSLFRDLLSKPIRAAQCLAYNGSVIKTETDPQVLEAILNIQEKHAGYLKKWLWVLGLSFCPSSAILPDLPTTDNLSIHPKHHSAMVLPRTSDGCEAQLNRNHGQRLHQHRGTNSTARKNPLEGKG